MGIASDSLIKWISRHLSDITEEGSINRFELHYDTQSGPFKLDVFEVDAEDMPDASETAQAIYDLASDHAATRRGPIHRYTLLAFRPDSDEHDSATSFTVKGRFSITDEMESEPGNEGGALAQAMRHQEQTMVMLTKVVEGTMGRMLHENEELHSALRSRDKERESIYQLKEQLLSDVEGREARRLEQEQKAARMDKVMGMFLQAAPLLLGAIAKAVSNKGEEVSEKTQADRSLATRLRKVVSGLGTEELTELASKLDAESQQELLLIVGELNAKDAQQGA